MDPESSPANVKNILDIFFYLKITEITSEGKKTVQSQNYFFFTSVWWALRKALPSFKIFWLVIENKHLVRDFQVTVNLRMAFIVPISAGGLKLTVGILKPLVEIVSFFQ